MLILVTAPAQVSSPKKGSPVRTAILDAVRVPVQRDLKQKVQFKVDLLKVHGNWAFMKGLPQRPDGKQIDYSKTKYAEAVSEGAFGYSVCALLKKKGDRWSIVKYVLGASDVPYTMWWKNYGAPKAIVNRQS
jgi:hypothetical protein